MRTHMFLDAHNRRQNARTRTKIETFSMALTFTRSSHASCSRTSTRSRRELFSSSRRLALPVADCATTQPSSSALIHSTSSHYFCITEGSFKVMVSRLRASRRMCFSEVDSSKGPNIRNAGHLNSHLSSIHLMPPLLPHIPDMHSRMIFLFNATWWNGMYATRNFTKGRHSIGKSITLAKW